MKVATGAPRPPLGLRIATPLLAAAFAFPTLYLIWRNFTEDGDPLDLLTSSRTLEPLGRTLRLAISVSLATAVLGTSLAWLTTRTDLPLRGFWRVVLPIPLVFPTFIGAAAFIRAMSPGGLASDMLESVGLGRTPELRGFWGALTILVLFTYPYVYLPVAARLRQLPGSLEESARLLGDSAVQTFGRIVAPQIAASIIAGTLLVFLYTISDFGAVQLMRYDTLTRAIETNYLASPPVAFALSLFLLGLAAAVVVGERVVSRRMPAAGTARARRQVDYRLGRAKWPAFAFVVVAFIAAVGAPIATLLDWATGGRLRPGGSTRPLAIDRSAIIDATWNTLLSSALAAAVAIAAVLPIAFMVGRYRSRSGAVSHAVVIATFALPGILIALSLRFWTLRAGFLGELFSDSLGLLIFAYVVRFASLAMGVTLVAVRSVPSQMHDAARTLGADRWRRLRTIDLPLMRPGLLAGAGLVLLSTMKELPISLIIAPIGFPTLTTKIFGLFEESFVVEAGILALVLVGCSAVLTWFLVLTRADHL